MVAIATERCLVDSDVVRMGRGYGTNRVYQLDTHRVRVQVYSQPDGAVARASVAIPDFGIWYPLVHTTPELPRFCEWHGHRVAACSAAVEAAVAQLLDQARGRLA